MPAQTQACRRESARRSRESRPTPHVKSMLTQQRDLWGHAGMRRIRSRFGFTQITARSNGKGSALGLLFSLVFSAVVVANRRYVTAQRTHFDIHIRKQRQLAQHVVQMRGALDV